MHLMFGRSGGNESVDIRRRVIVTLYSEENYTKIYMK
jgi:hypothetical protein